MEATLALGAITFPLPLPFQLLVWAFPSFPFPLLLPEIPFTSRLPLLRKTRICQLVSTYISRLYLAQNYCSFWRMNVFFVPRCTFSPLPLPRSHRVNEAHCAHKFVPPPSSLFPQVPRADQHGRSGKTSATTSQREREREEDFSSVKKAGLSLQKFAWLGLGELGLLAGSSRSSSHLHV